MMMMVTMMMMVEMKLVTSLSAVLTCGFDEQPWVSLSIVPDEGQDPRIDLLSYEFLSTEEREEIAPSVDREISQSGLG